MFYYLNKLVGDATTFPSTSLVLSEIEKDIYAYENGIACETHQNNEAINWCALSKSIRYSYSFLEHFCPYFGISLKLGCHVPESAKIKESAQHFDTMVTVITTLNFQNFQQIFVICLKVLNNFSKIVFYFRAHIRELRNHIPLSRKRRMVTRTDSQTMRILRIRQQLVLFTNRMIPIIKNNFLDEFHLQMFRFV